MGSERMKKYSLIIGALLVCGAALADTQTTKWYIDGRLYETTSCETGGDITLPTLPERFGHTFQGWEPAIYDMSTLDTSINGTTYSRNESTHSWNTTFSYGIVYGASLCSPTSNNVYSQNDTGLDTTTGEGRYCYCRVTEFIPSGSDKIYEPVASRWVFRNDRGSASNCAGNCAITVATASRATRRCALASSVRFRNDVLAKCRGAEIRGTQSRQGGLGEGVPHHRLT